MGWGSKPLIGGCGHTSDMKQGEKSEFHAELELHVTHM